MFLVALLFALVAPLLLLPVEAIFPYPHIVEELVKLVLVLAVLKDVDLERRFQWIVVMGVGFAFTLSETMFYLTNFLALGSGDMLFSRLVITGSLHVGTSLLMYVGCRFGRLGILIGLALAVLVHYLLNFWLGLR